MSSFDPGQLKDGAKQMLSADSFAWLTEKRWFADKGKTIKKIEIADLTDSELAGVTVLLSIVDVEFQDDERARYFVPLLVASETEDTGLQAETARERPAFDDAATRPEFGRWLAKLFSTRMPRLGSDMWLAHVAPATPGRFRGQSSLDGMAIGGEQSNSSLKIGGDVVVKILRRLQPGVNPEDEVLQALSGFEQVRVSDYLGSIYWHGENGQQFTVVIAQSWVPNRGDGWAWILGHLSRAQIERGIDPIATGALRELGARTAELHVTLAAVDDEAFGVQAATAQDVAQVQAAFRASLKRSLALTFELAAGLPVDLKPKLPDVRRKMTDLERLAHGFAEEEGTARIRVHGDYHLGQVLRTTDDDWTIIDFEGEPVRSLEERRMRSSPLRDVAGMLRSISYARAVAEQGLDAGNLDVSRARDALREWEKEARASFIEGYRTTLAARGAESGVPLVPQSDSAFKSALAAWEADKALYEVVYEARNRPGWIGIPLRALFPEFFA